MYALLLVGVLSSGVAWSAAESEPMLSWGKLGQLRIKKDQNESNVEQRSAVNTLNQINTIGTLESLITEGKTKRSAQKNQTSDIAQALTTNLTLLNDRLVTLKAEQLAAEGQAKLAEEARLAAEEVERTRLEKDKHK